MASNNVLPLLDDYNPQQNVNSVRAFAKYFGLRYDSSCIAD